MKYKLSISHWLKQPIMLCLVLILITGILAIQIQGGAGPIFKGVARSVLGFFGMSPAFLSPSATQSENMAVSSNTSGADELSRLPVNQGPTTDTIGNIKSDQASQREKTTSSSDTTKLGNTEIELLTGTEMTVAALTQITNENLTPLPSAEATLEPEVSQTPLTELPTPTQSEEATITPTPEGPLRSLSIGSTYAEPGQPFSLDVICDDLSGVAGGDLAIAFSADLIDLVTVHKSAMTEEFLLIKKKTEGTYILSLAGFEGLAPGPGVLLTLEGIASTNSKTNQSVPVAFQKARLYDSESNAINLRTLNGAVYLNSNNSEPTAITTPLSTLAIETPLGTIATDLEPTIQDGDSNPADDGLEEQPTESSPSATDPPVDDSDGIVYGVYTLTPTVTLTQTSTHTASPTVTAGNAKVLQTDLNGDSTVDSQDLFVFIRYWMETQQPTNP
jgi:hypothetical protein